MYKKILVALDCSPGDKYLLDHIEELAKIHQSFVLLMHVADGWVARNYEDLMLKESEEMIKDRQYLEEVGIELQQSGLNVSTLLALGNPVEEILKVATKENCELIVMSSHGHRFFADLFLGSTIEEIRHQSNIPLLIIKPKSI